ncbi:MAG: peptidoglycan-binding protein [Christensenellales bacterium]|jgi:hypothetical protein
MVKTYSASQKGEKLTKNFTVGDFWACERHKTINLDTVLAQIFEKFYQHFGKRPHLRTDAKGRFVETAGYRDSVNWNGSKTSQHCYGKAVDFAIDGVSAYELAKFAETLPEIGGIGLYLAKSGELHKEKHIHIDTRVKRTLWGWNGLTSGTNTPGHGGIPCVFRYVPAKLQRSAAIEDLQRKLNSLGYDAGKPDGIYGQQTKAAVTAFQKKHGLKADGIFGKATNKKLGLFDWS